MVRVQRVIVYSLLCTIIGGAGATQIDEIQVQPTALLVRTAEDDQLVARPALRALTGGNTYLTSAAISPREGNRVLVATTFHGIYESVDGGESWTEITDGPAGELIHRGGGFYEDIAAAAYDPHEERYLWMEYAQDGRVVAVDRTTGARVDLDEKRGQSALERAVRVPSLERPVRDAAWWERRKRAADHTSFYLSPWQLDVQRLERHMEFADRHEMTAVVIDFKDDHGNLAYDSRLDFHQQVGAIRTYFNARRVIDTVHSHDLYLIARIVVFKDKQLYGYDDNRYALWDRRHDRPWGVFRTTTDEETGEETTEQIEYWVDPFSEDVWEYNIAIAKELVELGVDEIQFDYIRTPAEGRTADIVYRFRDDSPALQPNDPFEDDRVEALSSFLERARQEIAIPIGVDVFGYNGWYRMGFLGQDIGALSRYVDVISPMLYPSHFPRGFLGDVPYLDWAQTLYEEGVARGRRITQDDVLIRPYVQAFLIGGELQFDTPTYTTYLKRQIKGALNGGASGFTLWNNSGRYYMVANGLWMEEEAVQPAASPAPTNEGTSPPEGSGT